MSYIDEVFARIDLQQIRNFLIYGTEEYDSDDQPYSIRLKNGSDAIYKRLGSMYPDETERDKAAADLSKALSAYESVYMELGMKVGVRLIYQLLLSDDPRLPEGANFS